MKHKLIFAILLFSTIACFAQNVPNEGLEKEIKSSNEKITLLEKNLHKEINSLQFDNGKLKSEIGTLNSQLLNSNRSIDSLRIQIHTNSKDINQTSQELGLKITTTETNANQKISAVDESLSKNSLYGIIGVLSAILLSGLLYWLLSKRQKIDKTDFIDQLSKTKSSIEESLVKEFEKQTELMEAQLILIEQQKVNVATSTNSPPDHSLALKVADELTLIERNISLMDAGIKGLKQLSRSVEKIKDNLSANGYEIPVLLGKAFNQGMKIVPVSTIPDENLEVGVEIISKVIKPQVNYNDKMLQAAQIEVSVGY